MSGKVRHPDGKPMIRCATLVGAVAFVVVIAAGCKDMLAWKHAPDFRTGLRCGMSLEEVADFAARLGAERTGRSDATTHQVVARNTRFLLRFDAGRLVTVQEVRLHGLTGADTSVERNLCSGEVRGTFVLSIVAPPELSGGHVYIDGAQPDVLSNGPTPQLHIGQLSAGVRTITVVKNGYAPIRRTIAYQPRDYWMTDNRVHVRIRRDDLRKPD